ncbi:hypothetical protein [Chamaesiphon polymorphus]|uniref:Uncharacterized protein n=1 Tax=Chamaesiphon polymorphus CCALA 037 TaxID=2107692 RepID=A0A2T1GC92_9CYAN|nr:hypothetical protein [Chamaesiphon polymorphus]PSB55002.1 hypothetical protein C7B77_16450 [Chamaesiphon polymorphus CCALA 037]
MKEMERRAGSDARSSGFQTVKRIKTAGSGEKRNNFAVKTENYTLIQQRRELIVEVVVSKLSASGNTSAETIETRPIVSSPMAKLRTYLWCEIEQFCI